MMEDVALVILFCVFQDLGFVNDEMRTMLGSTRRWDFLGFRKRGSQD